MGAQPAKDSIQADALWKEYDFVSSLIPMYRGFEMQAMQLAIAIFTAWLHPSEDRDRRCTGSCAAMGCPG